MNDLILSGLEEARKLTKEHAKTFYFASRFLGREKRFAAYAVYAICRISDDSVDSPSGSLEKLKNIENKINSAYSLNCPQEPLLLAFKATVDAYKIHKDYFDELISGMYLDLDKKRYNNFEELYDYCYKVAGVVGLIMLQVFSCRDEKTKKHAVDLGIAMQLTNILRDIKEDLTRDRIYLPQDEMNYFKLKEEELKSEKLDKKFIDFIKFQIQRARKYYRSAEEGIKMIVDKRSRLVVWAMSKIYAAILDEIERNQYDIFSKRARVKTPSKLGLLAKIIIKGKYL